MRIKYTAKRLFEDFRNDYPELWRYGTHYYLYGIMTILIKIPTVGVLTYEKKECTNVLTWLEHWDDPKEKRFRERENHRKDYEYFIFMLEDIMNTRGLSQRDVSNLTGYSRVSINRYLSGQTIPKRSTMEEIADVLDFDF